jgi:hypothetical protein
MPSYMVQTMSDARNQANTAATKTYYRAQSSNHVSHEESGRFTRDAIDKALLQIEYKSITMVIFQALV